MHTYNLGPQPQPDQSINKQQHRKHRIGQGKQNGMPFCKAMYLRFAIFIRRPHCPYGAKKKANTRHEN